MNKIFEMLNGADSNCDNEEKLNLESVFEIQDMCTQNSYEEMLSFDELKLDASFSEDYSTNPP